MQSREIRQKFLDFFEKRGHAIVPSSSLVPENDPSTLFTGSGMQPMVPYLLGETHPQGARIADSQKCFRSVDIEEVGDNRHTTFFEMLGNWSLGDYFKKEQIEWMFEFLTQEIGIDPKKIYVTVFIGDSKNNIPRDTESAEIWRNLFAKNGIEAKELEIGNEKMGGKLGMQGGRIFYYDAKKNWWSRWGVPENMPESEPGGPDSEIFYEFEDVKHDKKFGEHCHPNCDCGRFLEIGNNVFMEYKKDADGTFSKLPKHNVDFGGGLERIAAASINNSDVFQTDAFKSIIEEIEVQTGRKYQKESRTFRIVADHLKAATFLMSDGIIPSNKDRGYYVRRLIRRAKFHLNRLKEDMSLGYLSYKVGEIYRDSYPSIFENLKNIVSHITDEEGKFAMTLGYGLKEFEKGVDPFILFSSYGFPLELIQELALEKGITIDEEKFRKDVEAHQEISRAGMEQKFKGGLAGHSEMEVKYHTATHLLHQALHEILGQEVMQRGSNITSERLRFDFSFDRKLSDEEKRKIEQMVNDKIKEALPVQSSILRKEEAIKLGAKHFFDQKYPDEVSVYYIGENLEKAWSKEFCGGPHVQNTSTLGKFKIVKEEAVSAGTRRIKAVLE